VEVPSEVKRVGIQPRVSLAPTTDEGSFVQQLELSRDDEPVEFIIDWHCNGVVGGITPAIVSMPLLPIPAAGYLRFYVGKMCESSGAEVNAGSSRSGRGWSLYVLLLLGVLASCGAMYYFGTKGGKEQWTSLMSHTVNGVGKNARATDTLQRGEYEIVSQKVPRRRDEDGI